MGADSFLGETDNYGLVLPANKQTQLFNSAIQTAFACLAKAERLNVHSQAAFDAADAATQAELSATYGQKIANNQPICRKIIEEVGSLRTLRELVSLQGGYTVDTSKVGLTG